jgi:hypothetical protein
MRYIFKGIILLLFITGCNDRDKKNLGDTNETDSVKLRVERAKEILDNSIKAHGGSRYDSAHYQFIFRDKQYGFNNQNGYIYSVVAKDSTGSIIVDSLRNGNFTRTVDNETIELSSKDVSKYSNALNSVIYFALLPYKLMDKAVKPTYLGETIIDGEDYDVVEVTFGENGGGKDYDDVFCYWINKNSHYMNYMAYSYHTNDGGVRFRSAYNPRTVDGIRFQDYVNWEAPLGTPLEELPKLYENGQLKELSKIETEAVQNQEPLPVEEEIE